MAQFSYAAVTVASQKPANGAKTCVIEQSACFVTAAYFDLSRAPLVPVTVRYRMDDLASGENIVPWTSLTPAVSNQLTITSAQNTMVSLTRNSECRQVLLEITDANADVAYARVVYDVLRVVGIA
jgi:hypothetical protein